MLLAPVETEVDLQLLQRKCVVHQVAMNRSRRVSVVLPSMAVLQTQRYSVLKESSVLESFWSVAGHLHFDKGLQFFFTEDFDTD